MFRFWLEPLIGVAFVLLQQECDLGDYYYYCELIPNYVDYYTEAAAAADDEDKDNDCFCYQGESVLGDDDPTAVIGYIYQEVTLFDDQAGLEDPGDVKFGFCCLICCGEKEVQFDPDPDVQRADAWLVFLVVTDPSYPPWTGCIDDEDD
ncbi:MAG: hypothetical protein EZS28_005140 [Streblomastix strix]|uniref:Uncharacterized protein n=1 Tax=Streblomastix strix TaxID=222440 RepID=A0A5J4WYQ1_9EUKA|nr:MAG: hypothetical protein EZS28_005140 [Streblomastix strix]